MIDLSNINNFDLTRTLFVGMGNRIKQDDGAGIFIAEKIKTFPDSNVIIAENSIENYLGKINRQNVAVVIYIDAMDFGKAPGYCKLQPVGDVKNTTTNTHNLSLTTISRFINVKNQWIIGIQPQDISYGFSLSVKIKNTADHIIQMLYQYSTINPKILKL